MGKGSNVPSGPVVLDRVWTINGKTYDLTPFLDEHPGGAYALDCAAAHPNGELFVESYHPDAETVYDFIKKYEVKGQYSLVNPVNDFYKSKIDYTFETDGWYRKLKKTAMTQLRGKISKKGGKRTKTNLRGDDTYLLVDVFHICLLVITALLLMTGSWKAAVAYGILRAANIMRIAHVASHASLSPYSAANNFMYYISMVFAGSTPELWSRKHVVRHHVNTNEDLLDEDRMEPLKCAGKGALWFDIHRHQHIYMWFLYVHVLPLWSFSDIVGNNFRQTGALPYTKAAMAKNMITQFLHVMITYVLPLWACGLYGLWLIEIQTVLSSVLFGFEFIVNHEIEGCDIYNESLDKKVDWGLYQAISSADFHPSGWGAWLANQFTGGLNLQICHHLFPGIHYRYYPELTKIIYEHMNKEGHKPVASANVFEAVYRHYHFLKKCSEEFDPKNRDDAVTTRRSVYHNTAADKKEQ